MEHHFNTSIATKFNVNISIFLQKIAYLIHLNQENDKHFYKGRYWIYSTVKDFIKLFPYWTTRQMRTVIDSCIENGLIIVDNFHKNKLDNTKCYTLSDYALTLLTWR